MDNKAFGKTLKSTNMRITPHNFKYFMNSRHFSHFKYSNYSINSSHLNNLTYKY
jgi:hypothetical protein